jgi:type II secretion system protein C
MMVRGRAYALTLEVGLVMLVAALAALGVSIGSWAVLDDLPADTTPPIAHPRAAGPVALEHYEPILARDLFDPDAGHGAPTGGALRLWGVGLYGGEARAVVEDTTTHHQALYRVGDEVLGARIASIEWNRITLTRSGREETLELSAPATAPAVPAPALAETAAPPAPLASGGIRRTGANGFVVDRRELAGAVDNMSGLLTQLRAVAEVQDGRPAGFRLFQIRDDSLFRRLGIEDGDVVQRVNGTAIGDPAALLAFLAKLRTEPRVALDIERGGQPRTLVYDLR